MHKKDIGLGAVSMGFGAWVWYMAAGMKRGADFWPKIVAGGIILLGAIILVTGILAYTKAQKQTAGRTATAAAAKAKPQHQQVLAIMGLLFIYYFAFQIIGYTIPTFLLICATSIILGYRNRKIMVITSLLVSVALYLSFSKLFGIRFPGIFF